MQLFGPVLFYDLLRLARRGRYILLRCLYVILLLALVWWVHQSHFGHRMEMESLRLQLEGRRMAAYEASAQQIARFAEHFFGVFMAVQFLLILIVTPASTAGAIAEEKQRRTLEYILATDIDNREIVLGKLISRLGNLTLFLLAGLPVISLMLFLGGIDPVLLWAGFAATVLTMVSIASVSIVNSVLAKRPRDAIVRTYLMIAAYPCGWLVLWMLRFVLALPPAAPPPVIAFLDVLVSIYNAGNPFWGLYELVEHVNTTGGMGNVPAWLLFKYVAFHLLVSLFCVLMAVSRVRATYLHQAFGGGKRRRKKLTAENAENAEVRQGSKRRTQILARSPSSSALSASSAVNLAPGVVPMLELVEDGAAVADRQPKTPKRRIRPRPPIGDRPMLWKERYIERGFRLGMLGEGALALVGLACLFPGLVIAGVIALDAVSGSSGTEQFQLTMRGYTRIMGTVVACLLLVGIGIRAAGSISSEREKQTFDGLLASLLSNREILWAKWRGSVAALRWLYFMLALVLFLAAATLSLHWSSFLLSLLALAAYIPFMASLGLYFAAATKTGLRAVSGLTLTCLLLAVGPWLIASIWLDSGRSMPRRYADLYPGRSSEVMGHGLSLEHIVRGLSPPYVLYRFAYHQNDLEGSEHPAHHRMFAFQSSNWNSPRENPAVSEVLGCIPGVLIYGRLALLLWFAAERNFRLTCGRVRAGPLRRPPARMSRKPKADSR